MTKTKNKTTLKAQNFFLDLLPVSWSVQKNKLDYGIDYDISSSTMCAVNIKGTTKANYCGNYINCVIDTDKLDYYYKQTTKPIFIVLVDIVLQQVYWLFIQEYIENVLEEKQPNWRSKQALNIKIPQANNLNDSLSPFSDAMLRASKLIALFQYKLSFITVATSLQKAITQPQLLEPKHNSCSDNSCSSTACSCSTTDETALFDDYLTAGEKHYQEYISSLNQQNHQGCFTAVRELTNSILKTIDEGEYFTSAELTLRLVDIYFSAFTYHSKTVGATKAFTLMDSGQILLDKAHDLITQLETPNRMIN